MRDVFLVRVECGDYYCGCGGGHITGVYSTEELACEAVELTNAQKYTCLGWRDGKVKDGAWGGESARIERWDMDVLPPPVRVIG